ncbi:YaiO family outer membrane beta-barrel protein [Curvibacter sp. RS43]|uniref:YaiO family outer membrane beta-barrel protein n=1 Tax=Curvibacter microcysteis TaxID=3026419 RepID=A0ABT5MCW7_9BURK|nr:MULTISPECIES: YaiO family outer membrane beta-barrel protein [unclassified Curvibacter]MDD0809336.1 YaiO family outer membrane beta-barrel protein [Curvibacter sp. RS43]MDD0814433.1 YaiO family outer membrane beta-barrel protein [Curvibacter sp. HBC28]
MSAATDSLAPTWPAAAGLRWPRSHGWSVPAAALVACLSLPAWAQDQPVDAPAQKTAPGLPLGEPGAVLPQRSLEIGLGAQNLSNGFGNWRELRIKGSYEMGAHLLQGEVHAKRQFGQSGQFYGVSDTVTLAPDWFAIVSLGAGDGAFYLPRVRADGFLYKKWLPTQSLLTSVGLSYYQAPDGHIDRALSLGGAYYFEAPWIAEAGVRFNRSNPGDIATHQQFVALSWGRVKQDIVTVRYGAGGEGYQAIALNTTLINFQSHQATLAWRHWTDARSGWVLGLEHYSNPFYERKGLNLGVFHQFQ